MSSSIESLKIRAKLLQKLKKKSGINIPLKEALQKIATAAGYESWRELHSNFAETELFNPHRWSAQWKVWYSSKEEAFAHLNTTTDSRIEFLLPYHKQFFICDIHYINALGLSVNDEDLKKVGHDWTEPKDKIAWEKVLTKIRAAQKPK